MDAATSTLRPSFGLGPRGPSPPHGAAPQGPGPRAPTPGPRAPARGPSAAPRPEEQHHKPFFYVQPPQPYVSMQGLQWPMPMPLPLTYNPYYSYPGLGYGMSMLPQYQPAPYLEPPGFVLPHTHLHLMDYRRLLNPQYYHTMAYHSRRFRYQHAAAGAATGAGGAREMTSSQVQTEPLTAAQRTSTPTSGDADAVAVSAVRPVSPAAQKVQRPPELKETPPPSQTRTPPNGGGFLIQTEEVRIECCASPAGLQLLHARETAEVSHGFSQDADQSEQALQVCPDILLVDGEEISVLKEARKQIEAGPQGGVEETDVNDLHLKVLHLPFDPKYLEELRRNEASVWSMEETLVPSPEPQIQNGRPDAEVASQVVPSLRDSAPAEDVDSMFEMEPLAEAEDRVPAEEVMSDVCPVMDAAEEAVAPKPLLMASSPQTGDGDVQDQQDTSFESLPAYLPSSSWLADFDNVYYCRRTPLTPRKQSKPAGGGGGGLDVPTRRRKLDMEFKEQQNLHKAKQRFKPRGKAEPRSLSDHECCLRRSFNENAFAAKRERLCSRCSAKTRVCAPLSPGVDGRSLKRKSRPLQQWNDAMAPTCDACQLHSKKLMRKGSSPDVRVLHRSLDTEGESSENGSYRRGAKWRPPDFKRPLVSKQNAATYPKPARAEHVAARSEPLHQPVGWEQLRHCRHGNNIPEMDENCALPVALQERWRNVDQVYLTHRWHSERSWKTLMPHLDGDVSKNEPRAQHFIKHQTTQSQGTRKKDTRC